MVSGINATTASFFSPQSSRMQSSTEDTASSLNSFDIEDKAIISSQAKLQNELEKFNSGGDNLVDLVLAEVIAKTTVSAEVNVIQAKKHMLDDVLKMGDNS